MKRLLSFSQYSLALFAFFWCGGSSLLAQPAGDMNSPAFSRVGSPVKDRQALECERYLQKMNAIVQDYDQTVSGTLIGPQGINLDEKTMRAAARRTLKLAKQLKGVHPPQEIAVQ